MTEAMTVQLRSFCQLMSNLTSQNKYITCAVMVKKDGKVSFRRKRMLRTMEDNYEGIGM